MGTNARIAITEMVRTVSRSYRSVTELSLERMQPAFTATMLAGISPINVPRTNCCNGTETIGADTLMNQFGKIGVIRKKRI